ncbi:hypothetical protein C9374_006106 [Naegleria lovaniensis]|uniref:Thioredoxin domain-containing protein n=1 Tax=Naegleria lovaniensis TaxID=51637 RepID=A0AA88KI16_NAELO|nr:uncharacterized protein C9374_006106 [Naegleria lovaniensis]KAG2381722.1 hypothetical protein C9374_006106 [Naegleria lovaniensis]
MNSNESHPPHHANSEETQQKTPFWSFSTIQAISEKIDHHQGLTWKEFALWKFYELTDHPKPRGNVIVAKSMEHFDEILNQEKPVAVAFTAPYKNNCEHLKKKIREMAPYFEEANFVEVDCSITPNICYQKNLVSVPAMDVFYKPDKNNDKVYRYRYSYSHSVYGFQSFLKDYGLSSYHSPSIFHRMVKKLEAINHQQQQNVPSNK